MAKVEIEESDLLNMRHVANVVNSVMADAGSRREFLRLAKSRNPTLSIPEVDAAAPIIEEVNSVRKMQEDFIESQRAVDADRAKKMDEFLAAQEAARTAAEEEKRVTAFQQTWEQQESQLRREGWRDSGIEQVRKFAEDNGISNLRIAADAYERRNPQPGPVESRPGWNLFQQPETEDTFVKDQMEKQGEDDSRLDREIADTLAEVRAGY